MTIHVSKKPAASLVFIHLQKNRRQTPSIMASLLDSTAGQESCGIAVCDTCGSEGNLNVHRGMGLVHEVFDDNILHSLTGNLGVGHVRYSTTGETSLQNAQPLVLNYVKGTLALAHNGNLVNTEELRAGLARTGAIFQTTTDSEVIAHLIARELVHTHSRRRGNSTGRLKNKRSLWTDHCKSEKTDRR